MPLLTPKNLRRRRSRPLPGRTVIMCVLNGHQVSWCRGLCAPINGYGMCGRLAPHAMKGRTQLAIAAYKRRLKAGQD